MMRYICFGALMTTLLVAIAADGQENWPRFRGANATGVALDDPQLADTWDTQNNVKWVADVPGWGWSSPVVWGDRVFVTTGYSDAEEKTPSEAEWGAKIKPASSGGKPAEGKKPVDKSSGEKGAKSKTAKSKASGATKQGGGGWKPESNYHWMVYCFDANTGDVIWSREAHTGQAIGRTLRRVSNSYASSTPTTDGERVYALFGEFGLYCYDFDGNELWTYPLQARKTLIDYGYATSPIAYDGSVIFTHDDEEDSFIASIDGKTGKENWKVARDEPTSYGTPVIWENGLRTEIFSPAQKRIRSYGLDGSLLWEMDAGMTMNCIPSPFISNNTAFASSGYYKFTHRPVYAFKPGATGDITLRTWDDGSGPGKNAPRSMTVNEADAAKAGIDATADRLADQISEKERTGEFIQWYLPIGGTEITSPIAYGDYYYALLDTGFLVCYDAKTGKMVYDRQRLRGRFMTSPWAYNGMLFCQNEKGKTYVIKAGPDFDVLHENHLDETCIATPAIAQGKLFIRTETKLYCITKDGK